MRRKKRILVTADHHFGHRAIIKHVLRPFRDVQEMDGAMIDAWNVVVGSNDTVYHLGDFTLDDNDAARHYFSKLNGNIIVLGYPWHHDRKWVPRQFGETTYLSKGGHKVVIAPPMYVLFEVGDWITLCHFRMAVWNRSHYGGLHFYGHSHTRNGDHLGENNSLDIGVDNAAYLLGEYRPFYIDEAIRICKGHRVTK